MTQKPDLRLITILSVAVAAALLSLRPLGLLGRPVCAEDAAPPKATPAPKVTGPLREPAVAGKNKFYTDDKEELSKTIAEYLAKAPEQKIENLRALVCPHAGYFYSGQTAAFGYKQLIGSAFRTVIILGPSHHTAFAGAYIAPVGGYKTPLGVVPLAPEAQTLAALKPFVSNPEFVAGRGTRKLARPDDLEHSIEVQVPFLQTVLKDFAIVPVMFGQVDPSEVANVLAERLDDKTLLVASSDLSHFHTWEEARKLDDACVKAICDLDVAALAKQEACGEAPVMALVEIAKKKGWKTKLLDYRNSGDVSGDKSSVVGYAAIAFFDPNPAAAETKALYSADERKFMLDLARKTLSSVVRSGKLPELAEKDVPAKLKDDKGCFVTLNIDGELRGCIGHIIAVEPLYKAIMDNAQSAALRDTRFNPVSEEELDKIKIEVSVLTKPAPLAFDSPEDLLKKLRPHQDGVVLKVGGRTATFLPQVWEQLEEKEEFLNHLSRKAGMPAAQWRKAGTEVSIYHVEAFKE